ncbi:hypothetical protein [Burkholderia gladioli]|uniref:hypothetical protein n=1 Tax=Burkholderia gladioli TaxID=28095 RepID=UPI003D36C340
MTNNTTAALTDDEREKLIDLVDRLIRNHNAVTAQDCIIGDDTRSLQWIAEHTRALLTSPREAGLPEGWKLVPIERSYDMRIKALIAFNTTEKETNDRGDALDAAHRAMLDAAPAAPVAEPQWLPIEIAPKDGVQILLSNGIEVQQGWWMHDEGGTTEYRNIDGRWIGQDDRDGYIGWWDVSGGMQPCPDRWMPMPSPLDPASAEPVTALVMHPLTDAALREALDEFELVCENNDVRRLTDDEKYVAQEFAFSLIHGDPSAAQAVAADGAACKGKNCGATDGVSHSPECLAEHEAAVSGAVAADGEATDERAMFSYHDDTMNTGVGIFCQPGDRPAPRWLLKFEDADRGVSIYESEREAREAFAHAEGRGYNCYLFSPTPRAAVSPATADERAAQVRGVFKRHAPVWLNKYPEVCSQIADELFAVASQAAAPQAATADERAALDPVVLAVAESLSDANQPGNIKAQISHLMARVREDVLIHDGKMAGNTVLAENRLHALIGLAIRDARASQGAAPAEAREPKLTVWYGSMPESNGKTNWTAILHRGDIATGMTIDRSEYPDRVRYEADRVRWLIGEIEAEPWILDYDADKHSGYKAPADAGEAVAPSADLIARCIELRELSDHGESDQTALRALADTYRRDIHSVDRKAMAVSHTHREAVQYVLDAARAQGAQAGKGGEA